MMKVRHASMLALPLALAAACGDGDDASSAAADDPAVEAAADASVADLGLDASTADAMSVDVAAGGVEPMTDPAAAAVPVDTPENAEPAAETPPAGQ